MADPRFHNMVFREQPQLRKPRPQYSQGKYQYRSTTPSATPTAAITTAANGSVRTGRVDKSLSRGSSPRILDRRRHTTSTRPRPRILTGVSSTMNANYSPVCGDEETISAYRQVSTQQQRPLSWHPSTSLSSAGPIPDVFPNGYSKDGILPSGYDYNALLASNPGNYDYTSRDWIPRDISASTNVSGGDFHQNSIMYIPSHDGSVLSSNPDWTQQDSIAGLSDFVIPNQPSSDHIHSFSSISNPALQHSSSGSNSTDSDILEPARTVPKIDTQRLGGGVYEEAWGDEDNESPTTPGDGDVLIGMGLYDRPLDSTSLFPAFESDQNFHHFSTFSSPSGKGLKLEEEWQPPSSEDGDKDESDDDANEDSEDGDESTLKPEEADAEGEEDDNIQPAEIYSHTASPADAAMKYSELMSLRGENSNLAIFPDSAQPYYTYESYKQPSSTVTGYGYGASLPEVYVAQPFNGRQDHEQDGGMFCGNVSQWEAVTTYAW